MKLDLAKWSASQRAAILARDQNVLVSAGAGSGKTSVLVERVISCLVQEESLQINRLLVVTFTEAAAAEMRVRIGKRLQALLEAALANNHLVEVQQLSQQLGMLEQAQISTLHSFCMRVVRNNFLHLGIEPRFRVLESSEALVLRNGILQSLVEERLRGPEQAAMHQMIQQFRLSDPARLTRLVFRIDAFSMSQESPAGWLMQRMRFYEQAGHDAQAGNFAALPWTAGFLTFVERLLSDAKDLLLNALQRAHPHLELIKYAENLTKMLEHIDEAERALQALELAEAGAALAAANALRLARAKDHPFREEVKRKRDKARVKLAVLAKILQRGQAALVQDVMDLTPMIRELVTIVLEFQKRYQGEKRRRGVLDFHDLEHYAYEVLTDPESGEAQRLQEQYAEIFVDEYQDTNPIQDAIVRSIARPQGNVFTVGDVKQSIYRFRMAEPKLFLRQYQTLGHSEPGQVIDLSENYRSRAEVVEAVNFFFQQFFTPAFGGIRYDEKTSMKSGADYPLQPEVDGLAGPVEFHLVSREGQADTRGDSEDDMDDGFDDRYASEPDEETDPFLDSEADVEDEFRDLVDAEREALVVAQRILEWTGKIPGHPHRQVWDASTRTFRPLQHRDIVVLMRSAKASMNRFLEVLEGFQIPAYGVTTTGFYGSLEIRWLLAALSAIDNPRQELEMAALLRSPFGGFTDAELAQIRTASTGNYWDALQRVDRGPDQSSWSQLRPKVNAFLLQLTEWRNLAKKSGAEEVVRALVYETGFLSYIAAMPFGATRQANVELFLDSTRLFDKTSMDGLFGFVAEARKRLSQQVDSGEARTLGENEDVVRFMTIHQSKGLEFPVVFVVGLGKAFHLGKDSQTFQLHRDLGFGPQLIDALSHRRWWTLPGFAIRELELSEGLAEEARILYVAMTRARERLVLVGSAKNLTSQLQTYWEQVPTHGVELPYNTLMQAHCYLDWLVPAVHRHPDGECLRVIGAGLAEGSEQAGEGFDAGQTERAMLASSSRLMPMLWNCPDGKALMSYAKATERTHEFDVERADLTTLRNRLARFEVESDRTHRALQNLDWRDSQAAYLARPGKISATDLRRLWVAAMETERGPALPRLRVSAEGLLEDPDFVDGRLSGRLSGIAFHAVMQVLNLNTKPHRSAVVEELERLAAGHLITKEQSESIVVEEVMDFLRSDLGQRLAAAKRVWREQPFFYHLPLVKTDHQDGSSAEQLDYVLVQGVIDCLAEEERGWLILDYKTDSVTSQDAAVKAEEYHAQVATYYEVVRSLGMDVPVESYIYFVKPRVTLQMSPIDLRRVFRDGTA